MGVDDKSVADLIEKAQHRGAAPPTAYTLLSGPSLPPGGYVIDCDWDGDLGDLSEDEESGETDE